MRASRAPEERSGAVCDSERICSSASAFAVVCHSAPFPVTESGTPGASTDNQPCQSGRKAMTLGTNWGKDFPNSAVTVYSCRFGGPTALNQTDWRVDSQRRRANEAPGVSWRKGPVRCIPTLDTFRAEQYLSSSNQPN